MKEINNEDYEMIQRYHNYELDEKEMQGVLKRMENDAEFEEHIDTYEAMNEALYENRNASKKKTLKEWDKHVHPKIAKRSIGRYIRAIAAVLVFALATWAVYHFMGNSGMDAQQFAMNEITITTDNIAASSTRGGENDAIYQEAYKAYEAKDYETTIASLKTIPATADIHADAQLFLGKMYLQQKDWTNAIATFEGLIALNKNQDTALWLQALGYIQTEDLEKAKANLKTIIEEDYPKVEDAKELLEKL